MQYLVKRTSRIIYLILLISGCFFPLKAQTILIQDAESGAPISYAKITLKDAGTSKVKWGGFSDSNGMISLDIEVADEDRITITFLGYEPFSGKVKDLKEREWKVLLVAGELEMPEVSIASRITEDRNTIPQKIETINRKDIEFQNPLSSADLLMQNGGIFVQKSQMGGGSPVIRGFEANKVLLVIDGVRMNNAIYRGGHLQNVVTIDPNLVEKTEVLFGPASVIYGSDALGGVMHFYSKKPQLATDKKLDFKINGMTRWSSAVNERTGHLDFSIGLKKVAFLTSFSGSGFSDLRSGAWHPSRYPDFGKREFYAERINGIDSMVANDNVHIQRFTGYKQYDVLQKVFFTSGERTTHTFNAQLSTSSNVPRYDRLSEFSDSLLKNAEWYYGPQLRILGSYSGTTYRDSSFFDQMTWTTAFQHIEESRHTRRFGNPIRNSREEQVRVASANLDAVKTFRSIHKLNYGAEVTWNWVSSIASAVNIETGEKNALDTRYPDGGSNMGWLAAYFAHKFSITDKVILNEGIRFTHTNLTAQFDDKSFYPFLPDQIRQDHNALSGNLGLTLRPGKGWKLAFLGATGFRAPNVDDVGKVFDSSPGNVIVPNPDVRPEYTLNGEISLQKSLRGLFNAEITGFYTHYLNALIVRDYQIEGQDSILYDGLLSRVQATVNAGSARIFGASAWVQLRFARYFSFNGTLTYTYGQDLANDAPLGHIPPLYGRAGLLFNHKGWRAEVYTLFNGRKRISRYSPSGEDNQKYAPAEGVYGWGTLNLKAAWTFLDHYTLQAGVENILDLHYRHFASGVSAPGRNFIVTLRASF